MFEEALLETESVFFLDRVLDNPTTGVVIYALPLVRIAAYGVRLSLYRFSHMIIAEKGKRGTSATQAIFLEV
jgi:hypothetical protein